MMRVYMSRKRNAMGQMTPIAIESNLTWAIPYWTLRKQMNPTLFWEFV